MDETKHSSLSQDDQYMIKVQGIINDSWTEWFGGLNISPDVDAHDIPITIITGRFSDQAALRGVLAKLWNLNTTLIEVRRIDQQTKSRINWRLKNE